MLGMHAWYMPTKLLGTGTWYMPTLLQATWYRVWQGECLWSFFNEWTQMTGGSHAGGPHQQRYYSSVVIVVTLG